MEVNKCSIRKTTKMRERCTCKYCTGLSVELHGELIGELCVITTPDSPTELSKTGKQNSPYSKENTAIFFLNLRSRHSAAVLTGWRPGLFHPPPMPHSIFKLSSGAKRVLFFVLCFTFLIYVLMIAVLFGSAAVQDVCIQWRVECGVLCPP